MTMQLKKQWRIALAVVTVALVYIITSGASHTTSELQGVVQPVEHSRDRIAATDKEVSSSELPALKKIERTHAVKSRADLFKSKSWYVAPPPPPPPQPAPPTAPPLPFRFLGKVANPGKPLTLVLSGNDRVYLVKAGDTIDVNYHVDGIQDGQIVLTYLPLQVQQYLTMGDAP